MSGVEQSRTRRAFFLQGSAALGASVVATTAVGASARTSGQAPLVDEQLKDLAEREAIRRLHLTFASRIEQKRYGSAEQLFAEGAHPDLSGESAIGRHNAYRQSSAQLNDTVQLSEGRSQADAIFHVEVEVCTPLREDCTAAQMARLQGHVADRRWETGQFRVKYVKAGGEWKIASLIYQPLS
jgi:SnoaL-like protein